VAELIFEWDANKARKNLLKHQIGWVIRIISCRKATLMERKAYEEN